MDLTLPAAPVPRRPRPAATTRLPRGLRTAVLAVLLAVLPLVGGASPVRAAGPSGGVVLDLYGGIHPFGGASVNTAGAPYWPGWDIARAVAVLPDGSGGWTLDGFGGIHSWGAAPAIASPAYWSGWDIARALVVLGDRQSGYVLDGFGGLHAFGPHAPGFASPVYWPGWDIARGIEVARDSSGAVTGGWVLDGFGGVHSLGTVPAVSGQPTYYGSRDVWQKLHLATTAFYTVARWGTVYAPGLSPDWSGYPDWGSWDATRDAVLLSTTGGSGAQPLSSAARQEFTAATAPLGGLVLDPFGGLHAFGGFSVDTTNAPYWQGWDIARSAVVLPDGSGGWTLDGSGGIHNWGAAPPIGAPAYWSGRDIARALVVLPDRRSGYVLDGFGGLHAFGPAAPAFTAPTQWGGWDIARGLAVTTDASGVATGGWVLDGWGATHAFGSVPAVADPARVRPGHDVWRQLHLSLDGRPYAVARYGIVSAPGIRPAWSGYADWGGWDATRDVILNNPVLGDGQAQPVSDAARSAFQMAIADGVLARTGCGADGWAAPAGKWIVISLECQQLSAYQDGRLVADTLVTTGRPELPTDRGHTRVLSKNHPWLMRSTWPRSSPYWYPPSWVQYANWIFPDGTAIHDASWEPDSALGPGSQNGPYASHGCIHVTLAIAQWIYDWSDGATAVDVV